MWIVAVLSGFLIILLTQFILDRRRRQRTFIKQGIPGPTPTLLWGNFKDLQRGSSTRFREWTNKYGKTFGYFQGETPVLVTSDLDIIKQVLIKNFSKFHSRQFSVFFTPDESIVHAKGKDWKRLRMIMSPTFSARRMNEMSPLVNWCVDDLLAVFNVRTKEGVPFDIMKDLQGLTLDVIASCAFGLEINALKDPNDIFLKKCREAIDLSTLRPPFYFPVLAALVFLFPKLAPVARFLMPNIQVPKKVINWFHEISAAMIESRQNQAVTRRDFIQLLIDANQFAQPEDTSELEVNVRNDAAEGIEKVDNQKKTTGKGKGMTLKEMQAQCMAFILAGYETSSTALAFTAYQLALNPDVQQKLQQEIDDHFPGDELPDYLSVQKMSYMDMVCREVLRLYSLSGFATVRRCNEDCDVNGLHMPKGSIVRIHMEGVHKDSDNWGPEDPNNFVPDRFLPERKVARNPLAWLAFGGGPRNCIGMRFALMEVKITLARVLKGFTICRVDQTAVPLKVTGLGIIRPKEGVIIKLNSRS